MSFAKNLYLSKLSAIDLGFTHNGNVCGIPVWARYEHDEIQFKFKFLPFFYGWPALVLTVDFVGKAMNGGEDFPLAVVMEPIGIVV